MKIIEDLSNKRFGRLTTIKKNKQLKDRSWSYVCKCDCGRIIDTPRGPALKRGSTKSCGCMKSENLNASHTGRELHHNWTGIGDISGSIWCRIIKSAQAREVEVSITQKEAWELFEQQDGKCALSGVDLYFAKNSKELKQQMMTASLDRIDSTKGYIKGNVQWVHKIVNYMKQDYNQTEFLDWCRKITKQNENVRI